MMTVPRSVSEALRARDALDLQDVLQLESLFGCVSSGNSLCHVMQLCHVKSDFRVSLHPENLYRACVQVKL